ncbi:hypothetical protein ACFX13_035005 [Malus domestica]
MKSRLPGGFAAQTITDNDRQNCAIARVVLQEGTDKVIISRRQGQGFVGRSGAIAGSNGEAQCQILCELQPMEEWRQ